MMKIRPLNEISTLAKASILFVFISLVLFVIIITTSFFPETIDLYFWSLELFVMCGYISWWLNNINVLRSTKMKGFYWYGVLLSVVSAILTIAEISIVIILHYRFFNIVGVMNIWKWQHPVMAYICDSLLWMVFLAWIIQYIVNTVIIIKKEVVL